MTRKQVLFSVAEGLAVRALNELKNTEIAAAQQKANEALKKFGDSIIQIMEAKNEALGKNVNINYDKTGIAINIEWDEISSAQSSNSETKP